MVQHQASLVKRLKVIQKWPIAQLAINVKYI